MDTNLAEVLTQAGLKKTSKFSGVLVRMTPREHQISGLKEALVDGTYGLWDDPGCVSADTEYLTPTGWKRMDTYTKGDKVAQFYPESREIEFVKPLQYLRKPCEGMIYIEPSRGTSQALSPEHRVLYYRKDGSHGVTSAFEFANTLLKRAPAHNGRKFATTFSVKNRTKLGMTDDQLRLQVAVMADGSLPNKTKCIVRVKKSRKIKRLRKLLNCAGVTYTENQNTSVEGFSVFRFTPPRLDKEFHSGYWKASQRQLEVMAEELPNWDGSLDKRHSAGSRFFTSSKATADFAQYCFAANKQCASLSSKDRNRKGKEHHKTEHVVHVRGGSKSQDVGPGRISSVSVKGNPEGFKYCFEVPTSFLLLRRNGYIFATGNTGKSLISYLYLATSITAGKKVIAIMPPGLTEQYLTKFYEAIGMPIDAVVMDGSPKERRELLKKYRATGWPDLIVIGYQMFLRFRKEIPANTYKTVICDEAHALKNPSSQTYKVIKEFVDGSKALYMTGSPQPTTPEDAFGLISLLSPDAYRSKRAFDRKHLRKAQMGNFMVTVGYKNLAKLSENLYLKARRVTKEEVLDLKKPNVIEMPITLDVPHKKLYNKLMQERILEVGDEMITAIEAASLRRHSMVLAAFPEQYTEKKIKSNMLKTLDDLMDSINMVENKLVIFANYVPTVESLAEYLEGYNPAVIYGQSNTEENRKKFCEDDTCRVVIINPQAGGAGLDGLQKVCHNVIFFEPIPSPGMLDQCASRLIRSGQKRVVNVYVFKVLGTVFVKAVSTLLGRTDALKKTIIKAGALLDELLGKL